VGININITGVDIVIKIEEDGAVDTADKEGVGVGVVSRVVSPASRE
jgi:hypothetical protein